MIFDGSILQWQDLNMVKTFKVYVKTNTFNILNRNSFNNKKMKMYA